MDPQKTFFRSKLFTVFLVGAAAGLLVFFNPYGFFSFVHGGLLVVTHPLQKVARDLSLGTVKVKNFIGSIGALKRDNESLIEENQKLKAKNALLRDMERENIYLREQLRLIPREKFSLEAAFVVGADAYGCGNWLEISKGSTNGIRSGMPVIVSGGILIGKIGEVHDRSAQVVLISNADSLVNAVDLDTEAKGIVRGAYGLGTVLEMVLQGETINAGDEIVSSGTGGLIPRGLLLGNIREVRTSKDGLFQEAILTLPVAFSNLQTVFVITE